MENPVSFPAIKKTDISRRIYHQEFTPVVENCCFADWSIDTHESHKLPSDLTINFGTGRLITFHQSDVKSLLSILQDYVKSLAPES